MRSLVLALSFATLTGCATLEKAGILQADPLVQGTISVASESQCRDFGANDPAAAQNAVRYMQTLKNATEACIAGINAGLGK